MKVKSESEVTQLCPTLSDPMDCSLTGTSVHGISQANTGAACHFLLQGIFPTQESKTHVLHWQVGSLPLAPPGKPKEKGVGE